MPLILRFAWSVIRHYTGWITGSFLAACLFLYERVFKQRVPLWSIYAFVVGGLLVSAFKAWGEEHERANKATADVTRLEAARDAAESAARETTDEMYWLLTKAQRHGLRRQMIHDIDGADAYAIWIGDWPVSSRTGWFYALVAEGEKKGFLRQRPVPGSNPIYELTDDAKRVLAAGVRGERTVFIRHGSLTDARSGELFTP